MPAVTRPDPYQASCLAALLALTLGGLLGCKRPAHTPPLEPQEERPDPAPQASGEIPLTPIAARCRRGPTVAGPSEQEAAQVEVGDAVALGDRAAVGVMRRSAGGPTGSVAVVSPDGASITYVDLGPPLGDADPPKPIVHDGGLFAAFYAKGAAASAPTKPREDVRELSLFRVDPAGGKAERTASIPQQNDSSLAFDVAAEHGTGLAVWDEDEPVRRAGGGKQGPFHGVIKAALIAEDFKTLAPARRISAEDTDAELPRTVARPGGFWIAWVAHKAERPEERGPLATTEGPGSRPTFDWIEAVAVDDKGATAGPIRRITPDSGHISVFELVARGDALDVFARDDGGSHGAPGPRFVRVTVRLDGVSPVTPVVGADQVGEGAPMLLGPSGQPPTVFSFVDSSEHVRMLPLRDGREPAGPPSIEDAFEDARPLLFLRATTVLAAFAKGPSPLGAVVCDLPR